jgi:putative ABC transport system permease protein
MTSAGSIRALVTAASRMARRDLRSGEVRLLLAALALAVASVSSVGFLVERARFAMVRDAAAFLAADALVDADRPIDPALEAEARAASLRTAAVVSFPSMALGPDILQGGRLVSVKAVGEGYPLRGELRIRREGGREEIASRPEAGEAWVDERLLADLGVSLHSTGGLPVAGAGLLRLGASSFRVGAVILSEPDRSSPFLGFAPRVLLRTEDLAATELVQPASRIGWRQLFAGDRARLDPFVERLRARLQRGQRIETAAEGRQDLRSSLQRADQFLGLVALLTALMAAIAVAVCARRFAERRLDAVALFRCLGATQGRILAIFSLELVLLGSLASVAGLAAGFGLHFALSGVLAPLAPAEHLPLPGAGAVLRGFATGLVLLFAFGLPPLERLRHVPPLRVFRRDLDAPGARAWIAAVPGLAAVAVLLASAGGSARLALVAGLGVAGGVAVLALGSSLALRLAQRLQSRAAGAGLDRPRGQWRFALASLRRRPAAAVLQATALGVGMLALLVLLVARTDLLREWGEQAPADAPDHFAINILPGQVDDVRARFAAAGIEAPLYPMVRGRLVAIDGREIDPGAMADEQSRSLTQREFNLSSVDALPAGNRILQGAWITPGSGGLSIEQGIAKRLGIGLGQRLRFDIAGTPVEARVTSIREVQWSSMRVNFFVILDAPLLQDAPRTYITAFRLPAAGEAALAALSRQDPNITVIDLGQVLERVRSLLARLADAAQILFTFAILAGILVLFASLLASQDTRLREAALLRALGATRRQLARVQAFELCLVGSIAGVLASFGAAFVAWALARWVFEFPFTPRPWIFAAALPAGALCALAGGRAGLLRVLSSPPWRSLRES